MAKESLAAGLAHACALIICAIAVASPAHAAVGRTAGSFDVSNTGAATYSIPIFTPPGPRAVQPSVALVYNSNAGVGYVGRGWSLAGFSAISRCEKTVAQDGVASPILLVEADAYCLDGNRLRLQSGTYGQSGSVWATEIANFSRITANGVTGNGPSSWTVERKDGLTYTYGGTSDSRILATGYSSATQWVLSEISDRSGNKVKFTWKAANGTTTGATHPVKIEWAQTSAGSGSYVYSMDFNYGAGTNAPASTYSGYLADSLRKDADLLNNITVSVSGTVKRKYVLTYGTSPTTGAYRLTEVLECSDNAASDCLSPTTITYQNGTVGFNTGSPALNISGNVTQADGNYDFNGDGIKDIAYELSGTWYVRTGSVSSGYSSAISTGLTSLRAGKLLGNRADQLLGVSGGTWYVYSLSGGSFSGTSTGITTAASSADISVADADGDGRDDLIYVTGTGYGYYLFPNILYPTITIAIRRNVSTGGSPSFNSAVSNTEMIWDLPNSPLPDNDPGELVYYAPISSYTVSKAGDFNRDGRREFNIQLDYTWCIDGYGCGDALQGIRVITFESDLSFSVVYAPYNYTWWIGPYGARLLDTDFNGDGCDDYDFPSNVSPYYGAIALSSCRAYYTGAEITHDTIGHYYWAGTGADWNGDGLKDLIIPSYYTVYVRSFRGDNSLGTLTDTGIPVTGAPWYCQVIVTDGNGDGLDDIGCLNPTVGLTLYYHNGTDTKPDLAVQFQDGFGVAHNVTYGAIARSSYTAHSNATYPNRDAVGGYVVVTSTEATDGVGGMFTTSYAYHGAVENLQGRGFLGFHQIDTVDSRSGVVHERVFERDFPYGGMMTAERFYQPVSSGGHLIRGMSVVAKSSTTLDSTTNNQRHFPHVDGRVETTYEVGGARNGDYLSHTGTVYTYDNWGNVTAATAVTTDMDAYSAQYLQYWTRSTSTSFSPNTTYWCLGLPTTTSVSYSATNGETGVTQSQSFTPDYTNCRMSADSTEPASSTLRVDTAYGYDSFGNVNSVSVTGRNPNGTNMTVRTTTSSWGTTGQFPVSVTNPLSQTTTRTYHSTFGSLLTETDPNSIVVANNTYDSFGRIERMVRADGTAADYYYYPCASYGGCINGDESTGGDLNRVVVVVVDRNTSNAPIRYSFKRLDMFDREIFVNNPLSNGDYDRVTRVYDAMGRVWKEAAPCDNNSCTKYWVTNTYDLLGRITQQSRPRSQSDATAVTTTFAYAGRTQNVTDPNSKTSTKILDVNGWMRRSTDHDGYYQSFGYDAAGSLVGVTDSLSNTLFSATYAYGAKPFQTATTDMDLGSWSYTFNSLGEQVAWTDAKSQSFSQTYDALSRVTSRTEAEGTTTWTWGTSSGSKNIGRLAGVSMTNYSEALSYDSIGRPSTHSITADSNTYDIDYAYNNQGLVDTLTYPTSTSSTRVKVKYGYAYGVLQTVTDWTSGSAGTVYWTANTQNVRGQTTQETLGNGVVTNRAFDAVTGWLNSIQSGVSGGTALQNQSYLYDKIGNITQRQENTQGLTENFYYDNLYRLDYSQLGGVTNLDLTYDATGNITARSDVNGGNTWAYHSTKKHAVANTGTGGVSYTYDANGNMITRAGQNISWTSYNYASTLNTATESTTFYYGPDRQYYRQDYTGPSTSETTYYIGGILEKVCPSTSCNSGTIDWRHYIKAEEQTVAIVSRKSSSTNSVSYPLEDNQGSSSTLTNSSGTLLARESFNAFGLPRDGSDWDGAVPSGDLTTIEGLSRRGYTGHSMLGRMGLIHMNGRIQDAVTGRFLSPDPTIPDAGFTQSYNRYAYVNNNPMSYVDPSGFTPDSVSFINRYQEMAFYYGQACADGWEIQSPDCAEIDQQLARGESDYQRLVAEAQLREYTDRIMSEFIQVVEIDAASFVKVAGAPRPPRVGGGRSTGQRAVGPRASPSSRYLPGGNLRNNEDFPGAHVLQRHVGRTDVQLQARFAQNSKLQASSTFRNQTEAEAFIGRALELSPIARMNVGSGHWSQHSFRVEFGTPTGTTLLRSGEHRTPTGVRVVIYHHPRSDTGYYVYTAYPE